MNRLKEIEDRLLATEGKHWDTAEAEEANLALLAHAKEDIRYLLALLAYEKKAVRMLLSEISELAK